MPVSTPGFAAATYKISRSLSEMQVANGHIEWNAFDVPKFFFDGAYAQQAGGSGGYSKPWDVTFPVSGASSIATFTNCYFKRDSLTKTGTTPAKATGTVTYTMPVGVADTVKFLGFQYNSSTGAVEILIGTALEDVSEEESPITNVELIKTPLYIVKFTTLWEVVLDMRNMPSVGSYI